MNTPDNSGTVQLNLVPGPLSDGTRAFPHPPPRLGRLGGLEYDNVVYSCEPGYRPLFVDLRVPRPESGPHPLIVWLHGGGWIYGSRRRLPPHLFDNAVLDQMLDAGYAVAAVDYRLAREAGFPGKTRSRGHVASPLLGGSDPRVGFSLSSLHPEATAGSGRVTP